MAEYYNSNGYPPPPANGYTNYPPPPRPQETYQPYSGPGYSPPTATQSPRGYRPPRDDQSQYSPRASGLQVGQYTGSEFDHGRERRNSGSYAVGQYRSSDAGYYPPPPQYEDRPRSRSSRRDRERSREKGQKHEHHKTAKDVGATLLGGALGTWAGRELGHRNDLVTVAGALAGAYAGHKLEGKHEKSKKKKELRGTSLGGGLPVGEGAQAAAVTAATVMTADDDTVAITTDTANLAWRTETTWHEVEKRVSHDNDMLNVHNDWFRNFWTAADEQQR